MKLTIANIGDGSASRRAGRLAGDDPERTPSSRAARRCRSGCTTLGSNCPRRSVSGKDCQRTWVYRNTRFTGCTHEWATYEWCVVDPDDSKPWDDRWEKCAPGCVREHPSGHHHPSPYPRPGHKDAGNDGEPGNPSSLVLLLVAVAVAAGGLACLVAIRTHGKESLLTGGYLRSDALESGYPGDGARPDPVGGDYPEIAVQDASPTATPPRLSPDPGQGPSGRSHAPDDSTGHGQGAEQDSQGVQGAPGRNPEVSGADDGDRQKPIKSPSGANGNKPPLDHDEDTAQPAGPPSAPTRDEGSFASVESTGTGSLHSPRDQRAHGDAHGSRA